MALNAYSQPVPQWAFTYNGSGAVTIPSGKIAYCFIPTTDTVLTSATDDSRTSTTNLVAITHVAGIPVYGRFTALTITSGAGNVYFG